MLIFGQFLADYQNSFFDIFGGVSSHLGGRGMIILDLLSPNYSFSILDQKYGGGPFVLCPEWGDQADRRDKRENPIGPV